MFSGRCRRNGAVVELYTAHVPWLEHHGDSVTTFDEKSAEASVCIG